LEEKNMTDETKKVQEAINEVRPILQADGGDIQLVEVKNHTVKVKLQGTCASCPMSQMTLQMGVEKAIKEKVPSIKSVESV
jgi:Fe-S cluster biogenesis protein NfuA